MLIIKSIKILTFAFAMFPIAFSALSVGILFASFNLAVSRNPDEYDTLFSTTMMAFGLIETFVFMGVGLSFGVYFL